MALVLWANYLEQTWFAAFTGPDSTAGVSLLAGAILLAIWFSILLWLGPKDGRFRIQLNIQKQHYIQAFCHLSIYVYLGLYWPGIAHYAPLIASQIVFAYFFEMLLAWSRGRVWQLRLGPFPIVFSINFFMWFRDEYFYLQLLMIALAYLIKEFVTWTWEGRNRHIFNPSGIVLTIVGILLLCTGTGGTLTYGYDLAASFYLPPNLYEVIFLLGLIVMFMFSTTLITFGSFIALWVLYGVPDLTQHAVDIYVLLGLTFLLTDPSTSPRNKWGKFLFGLAYGCLIFVTDVSLRLLDLPPYYDKVFPVPILNLLAPRFQVLGERVTSALQRSWIAWMASVRYDWAIFLILYVATFCAFLWTRKAERDGFITALPKASARQQSESVPMTERQIKKSAARLTYPEAWEPFGFRAEIINFQQLRDFEPRTAQEHDNYGIVLATDGWLDRAKARFQQALAIDADYAPALVHMGNTLMQLDKNPAAALEHLRRAVALDPEDSFTHYSLALALATQDQYDQEAYQHLELAVRLNESNFYACLLWGKVLAETGRRDEAIPYLRRAVTLRPRHAEARQWLNRVTGPRA